MDARTSSSAPQRDTASVPLAAPLRNRTGKLVHFRPIPGPISEPVRGEDEVDRAEAPRGGKLPSSATSATTAAIRHATPVAGTPAIPGIVRGTAPRLDAKYPPKIAAELPADLHPPADPVPDHCVAATVGGPNISGALWTDRLKMDRAEFRPGTCLPSTATHATTAAIPEDPALVAGTPAIPGLIRAMEPTLTTPLPPKAPEEMSSTNSAGTRHPESSDPAAHPVDAAAQLGASAPTAPSSLPSQGPGAMARAASAVPSSALAEETLYDASSAGPTVIPAVTAHVGDIATTPAAEPEHAKESSSRRAHREHHSSAVKIVRAVTIMRPIEELFAFWRNFENLPKFMDHLESVEVLDGNRSRWKAKAPAGQSVEWHAHIINEIPNRLIAWESIDDSDIENAGTVRFDPAPEGRGVEVRVQLSYIPVGGTIGKWIARAFGQEPLVQITQDLTRFKALMETGEIPTAARRRDPETDEPAPQPAE